MIDKGNILSKYTKFIEITGFPHDKIWEGKNVFLSWEGTGKTYKTIKSILRECQYSTGKVFIFSHNTNEKMYENYNQAKDIIKTSNNKPRIELLLSTREICRHMIKEQLPISYKNLTKQNNDEIRDIYFISFYKQSFKIVKKNSISNYYSYQSHGNNQMLYHLITKLNPGTQRTISHDIMIITSKPNKEPNWEKINIELDKCCKMMKGLKNKRLISIVKKFIDFKKTFNQEDEYEFAFFTKEQLNVIIQSMNQVKNIINEISKYDSNRQSLIVFIQHEKLLNIINNEFSEASSDFDIIRSKYNLIIDEKPYNCFSTLNAEGLSKLLPNVLSKHPSTLNNEEYSLSKMIEPDLKRMSLNEFRTNKKDDIQELTFKFVVHVPKGNNYIPSTPVVYQHTKISPLLSEFENILLLTTEFLPSSFLEQIGFTVYHEIIDDEILENIRTKDNELQLFALNNTEANTKKKNEKILKKFIAQRKKEYPNHCIVGKKDLGCDETFESLKGSNKFYKNPLINTFDIIASPRHPNEVFDYHVNYHNIYGSELENDFQKLLIQQKCIDDYNQTLARLLGFRKLYSNKEVKINFFYTLGDDIIYESIKKSRYIPRNISESILYFD